MVLIYSLHIRIAAARAPVAGCSRAVPGAGPQASQEGSAQEATGPATTRPVKPTGPYADQDHFEEWGCSACNLGFVIRS